MPDLKKVRTMEATIDETSWESFPASDPPAWTPVSGSRSNISDDKPVTEIATLPEELTPGPDYNYEHFTTENYNFSRFESIELNDQIPDTTILDIDGEPFQMRSLIGKRTVVETGSISCPMFVANIEKMNALADIHKDCHFIVLYTREAHPGKHVQPHKSIECKLLNARSLQRTYGDKRTILIDSLSGELHALLGSMPDSCFIFNNLGALIYRANWNDPAHVKILLSGLTISAKDAPADGILTPATPPLKKAFGVLMNAGSPATWDLIKAIPALVSARKKTRSVTGKSTSHDTSGY